MKIVTVEQMIDLEQRSAKVGVPPNVLMENAGLAVAEKARDLLGDVVDISVMVLVGPGNNGGDGLVAARHLHDWGARVHLLLVKRKTDGDRNFALNMERGIPWIDAGADTNLTHFESLLSSANMVIDALFGTGNVRPLGGVVKQVLEKAGERKAAHPALRILAVDLPSGLNADTGVADPVCLSADMTVTLGYPKIGLFRFPGAAYVGQLEIAGIGIPSDLAEGINTELITAEASRSLLPLRPVDANKGTFGRLLVVAGSINYVGAALLACEGAMRVGTGLVTLATPASLHPILAARLVEATYVPLSETEPGVINAGAVPVIGERIAEYDALLLGCGLGQHPATVEFVRSLLLSGSVEIPLLIDADGLNILAQIPQWWLKLRNEVVLTPHPGEMSRLVGDAVPGIQQDRLGAARKAAAEWGHVVVLKGAHTVVASPEGQSKISGSVNPGLASAGTGDVLSGIIAGLMAQGLLPFEASTCGVYLHAQAGELVRAQLGDAGMIASDLIPRLPLALCELRR